MGITLKRRLDKHGRVALPVEYRRRLRLDKNDVVAVSLEAETIILSKCQTVCSICDGNRRLHPFHGKYICAECRGQIATSLVGKMP